MSKIDVGVGEDFPVDEGSGHRDDARRPQDDPTEFQEWCRRTDAWHARRRRAFRAMRARVAESMDHAGSAMQGAHPSRHEYRHGRFGRGFGYRRRWLLLALPLLGVTLLVALISAAVHQPLVMLALSLLALAAAGLSHRQRHWRSDYRFEDDHDNEVRG